MGRRMSLTPKGLEQVSGGVSSSVSWQSWIWFPSRVAEGFHAMAREAGEMATCQAWMVVLRRKGGALEFMGVVREGAGGCTEVGGGKSGRGRLGVGTRLKGEATT